MQSGGIDPQPPGQIAARLRRDHDEILRPKAEITRRALFAARIEFLHDRERLAAREFHRASPRVRALAHEIGAEEIAAVVFYVVGENLADHDAAPVVAGDEEIQQRPVKVNRPGPRFIPGARRAMESQRGERILQHPIVLRRVMVAVLALVQVIIHIQISKLGAREKRVAFTDKGRPHFQPLERLWTFGIHRGNL